VSQCIMCCGTKRNSDLRRVPFSLTARLVLQNELVAFEVLIILELWNLTTQEHVCGGATNASAPSVSFGLIFGTGNWKLLLVLML